MGNIIAIWSGPVSAIPLGWVLCNGQNGTPDLRSKFVRGAYSDAQRPPGSTGGSNADHSHAIGAGGVSHTHNTSVGGYHSHISKSGYNWQSYSGHNRQTSEVGHSHTTDAATGSHTHTCGQAPSLPPYYDVAYIMALESRFEFPKGTIVMWTGAISEIPAGWVFCDGQNGTPDLRDRFLLGASNSRNRGGAETHTHALVNDGTHTHSSPYAPSTGFVDHTHSIGDSGGVIWKSSNTDITTEKAGSSHAHSTLSGGGHSHTVGEVSNLPAYYALAFIMRKE